MSDSPSLPLEKLVSPSGLSDRLPVFEPGLKIEDETVIRTFQPSFTATAAGTLLCFCQGRLGDGGDDDMKVVLVNRSFDFGRTWEGARAICAPMNHFSVSSFATSKDGAEVISVLTCVDLYLTRKRYGDDSGLLRKRTGLDLEIVGRETAGVLCRFISVDQGLTWRMETLTGNRTPLGQIYAGGTLVFLNAIGQIQKVKSGPFCDRLFLAGPVYAVPEGEKITPHFRNHPCSGSGVLFSDDRGESWKMNGLVTDFMANEASAVSIKDGREVLMVRRFNQKNRSQRIPARSDFSPEFGHRIFQTSKDWGKTWSEYVARPISGVRCHGTMCRVGPRILFSIPQGYGPDAELGWDHGREQGTIYFSDDDGENWSHRVIESGTFSYSTVGPLIPKYHLCLYGRGNMGEKGIDGRIFTNDWLEGRDSQAPRKKS